MADVATAAEPKGSAFGFLGHKLFGKVPVWVVAVAGVGGYYWYTRYGPGKKTATATAGQQTDPAGNVGTIDPATGFVYGTPEDLAASGGTSGGGDNGGGGGDNSGSGSPGSPPPVIPGEPPPYTGGPIFTPPGGGPKVHAPHPFTPPPKPKPRPKPRAKPPARTPRTGRPVGGGGSGGPAFTGPGTSGGRTNAEWQGNAVSNLISQGVPPDQASTSIQAHLNGQPLSPAMAANRDLAVRSIGSPPQVPRPAQATKEQVYA